MTHSIRPRRIRQRGMTLIEFMVGMTIGLLVVLAAVSSLIMTRSSAITLGDSAGLEQQATLVMMQIGQQISQTGSVNATQTGSSASPYIVQFNTDALGLGAINPANPTVSVFGSIDNTDPDLAGYGREILTISYTAPTDWSQNPINNPTNCTGAAATPVGTMGQSRIISQFSVVTTNVPGQASRGSLSCGNGINNPVPIASNVWDMHVMYLLNDGTASGGNILYQNPATNWAQVNGIQVCLELAGNPGQSSGLPNAAPPAVPAGTTPGAAIAGTNYIANCRAAAILSPDASGRIHRIVQQTFYLHNNN